MLDSLLFEPKRRRIAMATLAALLIMAVGFFAFGTLLGSIAVLNVFGIAFLAASIFFIGKLLVVSHVHIRGTAGRLEALNDRYDDTSRWLERFDADTRESFLVTKRRLNTGDAGRAQLEGMINKLGADTPRLGAIESLTKQIDTKHASLAAKVEASEAAFKQLKVSQAEAAGKAEKRLADIHEPLADRIAEIGSELAGLASLADRVELVESEVERFDAVQTELERIDGKVADDIEIARAAAMDELAKARHELDDKLRQLNGRLAKLNEEHDRKRKSAVNAAREDIGESVSSLKLQVDSTSKLGGRLRGDGYVQFSRVLTRDAIEAAESFGTKITRGQLTYLERKLQVIEGLCEGRLAGSVDDAIGRVLAGHMVRGKEIRILEIGVLFGVGAAFMHQALAPRHERIRLALLDPFQGYYGSDHLDPLTGLPVTRAAVERNMARCGVPAEDVEILEGFSHEEGIRSAAERAGPYHIIVIDGDHSAEGVRTDYEGYADMLRSGGLLVIDDYGSDDWPAVTAFVDDTVRSDPRFKPVSIIGKTAVFKRARTTGGKKATKRGASKKASAKNAVDPGNVPSGSAKTDARDDSGDPPVPVVKQPRRSKKRSSKKAVRKSAVPAGGGGNDDADS